VLATFALVAFLNPDYMPVTAFILHADGRISVLPLIKIVERIIRGFGLSA
jgi:hypothetical protein